jgi:hypothetical protein
MRAALLAALLACGPKVSTNRRRSTKARHETNRPPVADNDDGAPSHRPGRSLRASAIRATAWSPCSTPDPARSSASSGTARMTDNRFIGWELVQLVGTQQNPLYDIDLVPGDVLLSINGKMIARPDQLQTVWDGLRAADTVTAQLSAQTRPS